MLLLLCSCARTGLRDIPEASRFKAVSSEVAERFMRDLNQQAEALQTLKGSADVTLSKGLVHKKFLQTFAFQAPGTIRIESFVPGINRLVSLIVIDEEKIYIRDDQQKRSYTAEPSAANIAALIHLPLAPRDLALFLAGMGLVDPREGSVPKVQQAGNLIRVEFERGDEKIEQYFKVCDSGDIKMQLRALRVFRISDSSELFVGDLVSTSLYCTNPEKISVEMPARGISGKILLRKLQINSELKPNIFETPSAPFSGEISSDLL